jgi:1,4-alpha-glucan branching enzyme
MRNALLFAVGVIPAILVACGNAGMPDATTPGENVPGANGANGSIDASVEASSPKTDAGGETASLANGLGANVGAAGVTFRVWAPYATAARMLGDFGATPIMMSSIGGDVFEATSTLAHAGSHYSFSFDTPSGIVSRIDPYCRELDASSCVVVDPSSYTWHTPTFARPSRAQSVVYEMHIGSFSAPSGADYGTFASATAALSSLANLGVNVVELMPIQSFGSKPNTWGYNPQLYFAPRPELGSPEDLRAFVDTAHGLGIAVWMDTVINHCDSWSQAPLRCFDGNCPDATAGIYFFPAANYGATPWGPRPDYTAPQVSAMLLASADSWMNEFHGDGFRWDSVSNIRAVDGSGTVPGGQALLTSMNDAIHAKGGMSIAEDLKGYAAITEATKSGGFGFDAQWDGFGYTVDAQLTPSTDASRDLGQIASALTSNYAGDPYARLIFTEDHDTVGNGGARLPSKIDPANPTSWAARKRSIEGAVMLLTSPAVPMLFQGQEALATGTFSNPPTPLGAPTAQGQQILAFYKDMIRLRRNLDGGAGGLSDTGVEVFHRNDAAKVIAYRRYGASGQDVIVIVNVMNKAYTEYDIGVADAGPWRIRLNTDNTSYSDDFVAGQTGSVTAHVATKDGKAFTLPLVLGAYSAMILTH